MTRPYTGFDRIGHRTAPAVRYLVDATVWLSAGQLTNLGAFGIRPMRSSARPSVHGTGRAVDVGHSPYRGWTGGPRTVLVAWMDYLVEHADEIGLELLIDYGHTGGLGGGRAWRCDRERWIDLGRGVVAGGGYESSQWAHVELSPTGAADADAVKAVIDRWRPPSSTPARTAAKNTPATGPKKKNGKPAEST